MADLRQNPAGGDNNAFRIAQVDQTDVTAAPGTTFTVSKDGTHEVQSITYKAYAGAPEVTVNVTGTPTVSALTAANIADAIGEDVDFAVNGGIVKTFGSGTLTITNAGSLIITAVTTTAP
jgi:hypothetical protein